jgi:hypothetical protein
MAKKRTELDAMLGDLEKFLQPILKGVEEDRFIELFAAHAYKIEASAGPADIIHVRSRIDRMLGSRRLIAAPEKIRQRA